MDIVPHTLTKFGGMIQIMPFLFVLTSFQLWAQSHVDWKLVLDKECKVLVLSAEIDEGWHIYSQYQNEKAGPIPTDITLELNGYEMHGASETQPIKSFDENYGGEVLYFENNVDFRCAIPVDYEGVISVKVVFMTCNEEGCLPPELKEFKISI